MLPMVKSFDILPKPKGYGFISDFFALNWSISTPLTYKKLLEVVNLIAFAVNTKRE